MFRFLEDADLVEQERDDIKRILFDEKKSICQFPFTVDTTIGRTEDEATSCSYGHRSSSESLRAEAEACSSADRRSPTISLSTASTSSHVRRQFSSSGSTVSKPEQLSNRTTFPPSYLDIGSPKRNDCQQMNGNFSASSSFMTGYTPMSVLPSPAAAAAAAACFSPTFMPPACQFYPAFQCYPPAATFYGNYANGPFIVPQVVPRPTTHLPVAAANAPAFIRLANATHLYQPIFSPTRIFPANADQNLHFAAMDNNLSGATSFTGSAIIQEDVSLSRMNAQTRTSSMDEYQQQQPQQSQQEQSLPSSSPSNFEMTTTSTSGEVVAEEEATTVEEEDSASCDSPTIVIEADQNAAALASRQRASALINGSTSPDPTGAAGMEQSSNSTPTPDQNAVEEVVTTTTSPPAASTEAHSAIDGNSPAQSPNLLDYNDSSGLAGGAPLSPSSTTARDADGSTGDVYYDAEDKPLQRHSQSPNNLEDNNDSLVGEVTKITSTIQSTFVPVSDQIPAPAPAKTWASLLKDTTTAKSAIVVTKSDSDDQVSIRSDSIKRGARYSTAVSQNSSVLGDVVPVDLDPGALMLAEALRRSEIVDRGPTFHLRGIINRGNWCYVNASLQALMACPPFYHFLRNLSPQMRERTQTSTPLLDAFVKFANEFPLVKTKNALARANQSVDPTYLYSVITRLKTDATFKGRQEDAEEFLLQVFNVLHDEMVSCLSMLDKDRSGASSRERSVNGDFDEADNSEWHQVGPGRKAAVTRQTKYSQSPLSQIFLGQLRYGLSQPGAKESANLEPFYTLPLDVQINGVKDLATALHAFTSKEKLKSFTGKNKAEVDATRHVTFHELPRVLIFQLKYFVYADDGLKKIVKQIDYPMDLMIDPHLLFNRGKIGLPISRQYKLFAVVFHHGEKAEGGHYTVDIFHGGNWSHVDDTRITQVNNEHVLKFDPPRVPYLLFYRRWDNTTASSDSHQQPR